MRPELKGTLAVLGSAACYSSLAICVKLALGDGARILPLVAWRFLVGAALLWGLVGAGGRRLPPWTSVPVLLGLGALYAGDALAALGGLVWVPAATASLLFYTYPAMVVLLAAVFLGERVTRRRVTSLVLALLGCALTARAGIHGGESIGVALILLGAFLLSVFIVASHPVYRDLPALGSTAVVMAGTAAVTAGVALATGGLTLGGGDRSLVMALLLGTVGTAIPIPLFLAGVKLIGPGKAAIYSTVEPAFTVSMAALILGEPLTGAQLAGGGLILAAVVWLRAERPLPASEEPPAVETL